MLRHGRAQHRLVLRTALKHYNINSPLTYR
jgi:hypothetical protein